MTGVLQPDNVKVYYLSSWAVQPYQTATSLLMEFSFTRSLHTATSKLHLLLEHIPEVSAVTVEGEETRLFSSMNVLRAFFLPFQRIDILSEFARVIHFAENTVFRKK